MPDKQMRLTLRTLLAYLDDTLEPAQAKLIGQKVAESDTAQELIARIKQVTRRRRLTTPPPAGGPGGKIDANTIAEYLDNSVSTEQLAEVEQICLASDVHLAEVAACHQILTLVLGEPALVPPMAKQRMYGLVKGPEAIPFRKPPMRAERDPVFSDESMETDETLRLGLPPYRRHGSWSQRLVLIGGGLAAICLLAVAFWQVLKPTEKKDTSGPVVQLDSKDKNKPEIKQKKEKEPVPVTKKGDDDGKKEKHEPPDHEDKKGAKEKKKPKEKTKGPIFPSVAYKPPSRKLSEVGSLTPNEISILLQQQDEPTEWKWLTPMKPAVFSGRPLVSLPGARSSVELKTGVRLTLWGYLPELWPNPPLLESVAEIHFREDPELDLDMTFHRGRILLTNELPDRPVRIRLRFENPTIPDEKERARSFFDIVLMKKGAELLLDRWSLFPVTEPFYKDPKNPNRLAGGGPVAEMGVVARFGEIHLKVNDIPMRLMAPPQKGDTFFAWSSAKGLNGPHPMDKLPETLSDIPPLPLPPGLDEKVKKKALEFVNNQRLEMRKAVSFFHDQLVTNNIDTVLSEAIATPGQMPGPLARRRLAVRCFAAIDDYASLLDALTQEKFPDVRQAAVESLQSWIASSRDAEYKLFDSLQKKYSYSLRQATIIMDLLHTTVHSERLRAQAETYQGLIAQLNNDLLIIRELAAWHLYRLVPSAVPFYNTADHDACRKAQEKWGKLKLPPVQK
jgi:hypothetical protein